MYFRRKQSQGRFYLQMAENLRANLGCATPRLSLLFRECLNPLQCRQ
jgi:hypothetical protein